MRILLLILAVITALGPKIQGQNTRISEEQMKKMHHETLDDPSAKNSQWFGKMSVAPDGRIDAIWLDTRHAPAGSDSSALYYSFSSDQGKTWSVNEKLSASFDPHVGYPQQNKLGDYFDVEPGHNLRNRFVVFTGGYLFPQNY